MPNQIISVNVNPDPVHSGEVARATITYVKDGADILRIKPSNGFSVSPTSVRLMDPDRETFDITFTRSQEALGAICRVEWSLGGAIYVTHVEVLRAVPRVAVKAPIPGVP
ncbi:hypothetical protein LY474_00805 [Myxococcus stipitatus]|uniref:hypothetical protein n=1 Tax=Myxococcus stipitatus TaxID=83455 RepID=UPI001F40CEB2|nr:hypothetical protein [Myxococcus stipitatus]MCE9666336.1 hypothetical protein [Myxococcus stipitatus]